jgi:hypothetical protein
MSGRRFHVKGSVRLNGKAGGNGRSDCAVPSIDRQTGFEFLYTPSEPVEKASDSPLPAHSMASRKTNVEARDAALLNLSLELAVPLRIEMLRKHPIGHILNQRRLEELADDVACYGDLVMFRKEKGQTAEHFNRLAEGLARLAFVSGGVTFNGVHFEANP